MLTRQKSLNSSLMACLHTKCSPVIKQSTISAVHPRTISQKLTISEPQTMKGRRLPQREVDRSVMAPTIGTITRPERGPAIQTNDVFDLERPRRSRYGVQSGMFSSLALDIVAEETLQRFARTSHFNSPCDPVENVNILLI